jgi:hypothetical protein
MVTAKKYSGECILEVYNASAFTNVNSQEPILQRNIVANLLILLCKLDHFRATGINIYTFQSVLQNKKIM